ncbi:Uncharacterised protein [Mycobacterium tuberculosis]|uniref:Uncharacterized protein n=1 Tax=Mycobacterium tuberculosis TaxID=1773 RepID=A0A916LHI0_MYCTX|nr:Uncharacterised protein [Mycobacterium tuberculosis]
MSGTSICARSGSWWIRTRCRSPTTCSQLGIGRSPAVSRAIWNGTVFRDLSRTSTMSYCDTR